MLDFSKRCLPLTSFNQLAKVKSSARFIHNHNIIVVSGFFFLFDLLEYPFDFHVFLVIGSNWNFFWFWEVGSMLESDAGLLLWNQSRQQWVGSKRTNQKQVREPRLSCNATYENLLGTNKSFSQPIPLSEMVDFLVDVWEQEGLYDWVS